MSTTAPKDDRLNLRINKKLKKQVQKYCGDKGLDMSEVVTRFFERLIQREEERKKQQG